MAPRETKTSTAMTAGADEANDSDDEALAASNAPEGEEDFNFTRLTADWVVRGGAGPVLPFATTQDDKGVGRNPVGGLSFLVQKGEAGPSMVGPSPWEVAASDAYESRQQTAHAVPAAPQTAPAQDREAGQDVLRLREELAAMQKAYAQCEAELAQVHRLAEQEHDRWLVETQAAWAQAETAWKAEEAARMAEAQAQWRVEAARTVSEAVARFERIEPALKDAQRQVEAANAARDRGEAETRRLHEECTALRTTVATRDAALSQALTAVEQARAAVDQTRKAAQHELQETLAKAEAAWKAAEAARFSAAETQWREQTVKALTDARQEISTARNQGAAELHGLREELASVRAALVERETALARAELAMERMRGRSQQEAHETVQPRSGVEQELHRLREELATIQAALMDRETALARADLAIQRTRERSLGR